VNKLIEEGKRAARAATEKAAADAAAAGEPERKPE